MPRWIFVILRILFLFAIGVHLVYSPWTTFWTSNFFLSHYSWLSAAGHNNFVRGAISGVGIEDIWLALDELHRIMRQAGSVTPRPLP